MLDQDFTNAEEYFKSALELRKQLGNVSDIASVNNLQGLVQYYQSNDKKAIEYYLLGLEISKQFPKLSIRANLHNNISNSYRLLGDYKQAIKHIDKGIAIKIENGEEDESAKLLVTLGNWYSEVGDYFEAIENFQKAMDIFEKLNDAMSSANCFINIGNAQFRLGEYNMALDYLNRALEGRKYLDANSIATINRTKGNIYRSQNLKKKALESFEESLLGFENLKDDLELASIYYNIGLLNQDNSNYDQALEHYLKSISILDTIEDPLLELILCQEISEIYLKLGNIESAFEFSLRHNDLQDSLDYNYREAMNFKLRFEKEQQKNEILRKEIQVNELIVQKKEMKMRSYIGLGFAVFILLVIAFLYVIVKRRTKYELNQKNQEIDNLLKNQEVKTTYAKLEGQDEERKRIAQDLHDRVGSILSTIKLYFDGFNSKLDSMQDSMQSENQRNHDKANMLLDEAVSEVRKIAQNIDSGTLTKFGLKAELEALSELLIESKKIDIQITTFGLVERLPVVLEIKIYRIIQELISNILKHAKATKITIQINQFKKVINVIVQDNGIGFDVEKIKEKNGMGLKSIKSRVYNLHGSIIIDSGKANGTTVTIDMPREH